MTEAKTFALNINGKRQNVRATPDMPLLWALRQEAGISGVKFGCGGGFCGACTVHLDGAPVRSCQTAVGDVGTAAITTIEGLTDPLAERLKQAWLDVDVMQCGYCQAGQILSAHALLREKPKPSVAEVDAAMEGNICRCATYNRIRTAVIKASGQGGKA
jgi:isoquinoline 1-oxidoreductase subunit alpha